MRSALANYIQKKRRGRRLGSDLYALFDFEISTYTSDSTGNAHTLTVTGAPGVGITGKTGYGLLFDTVANYAGFQDFNKISPSVDSLTFAGWFKQSSLGNGAVFSRGKTLSSNPEFALLTDSSGRLVWRIYSNAVTFASATTTNATVANSWQFFVAWYDRSSGEMGVVLNLEAPAYSSQPSPIAQSFENVNLGYFDEGPLSLNGVMDTFGVWRRVLSPRERVQLYKSGIGQTKPFRFSR
jgi:hypothetical protein